MGGSNRKHGELRRTNSDGLNLDAIFDVGFGCIVGLLMLEDILAAEGVDKGGSAYYIA